MNKLTSSNEVGSKIKTLRQQLGLSQENLAEILGISAQQIQKYESGQSILNIVRLQQVAQALKVSVNEIFSVNTIQQPMISDEEDQLLQAFRKIKNAELRSSVLKLLLNINRRKRQ